MENNQSSPKKLVKDQLKVCQYLIVIGFFGRMKKGPLAKIVLETFAEIQKEFKRDNSSYDPGSQKQMLDRIYLRLVNLALKTLGGNPIRQWIRNDSFAAWKICSLQDELISLSGRLIEDVADIDHISSLFVRDSFEFNNDHNVDFVEIRKEFDFTLFSEMSKWFGFLSGGAPDVLEKIGIKDRSESINAYANEIIAGDKSYVDVADELMIDGRQLRKALVEKKLFNNVLKALLVRYKSQGGKKSKFHEVLGVRSRSTAEKWADEAGLKELLDSNKTEG